jgi:hypothetical protein
MSKPLPLKNATEVLERIAISIIEGKAGTAEANELLAIRYCLLPDEQRTTEEALFSTRYQIPKPGQSRAM